MSKDIHAHSSPHAVSKRDMFAMALWIRHSAQQTQRRVSASHSYAVHAGIIYGVGAILLATVAIIFMQPILLIAIALCGSLFAIVHHKNKHRTDFNDG